MLLALFPLILNLLPGLLKYTGLSANIDNLIAVGLRTGTDIVAAVQTGGNNATTDLTILEAALAALQADTSLDPAVLAELAEGARVLQAGIAGYKAGVANDDPSNLSPEAPAV